MRWLGKGLLIAAVLALAYYPLMMGVFAGMLTLDQLQNDAREEWKALGRGEADATITEVRTRCRIRERRGEGGRRRTVNIDVACDRFDDEVAARGSGIQKLSPVQEIVLAFTTDTGQAVTAVSSSGPLRLREPIEPGRRLRISYDRRNPEKSPQAARGTGAIVALAVFYALLAAAIFALWRWLRRSLSSLGSAIRRST